ncbi:glycosyltransferase family 2 protein, partial [Escherichia coli]|nr:glycosyltransferase family 2 protein [Escherichia coli]
MKNLLITIIVASYNSKDYILETLESCINQQ